MSIPFTNSRIPLGGPIRGMVQAIVPRNVDWAPVPIPFAGMGRFMTSRLGPFYKTQISLLAEAGFGGKGGFHGEKILRGRLPEQIARGVLYELESVLPLSAGAGMGGLRRANWPFNRDPDRLKDIPADMVWQFMGANLGRESPSQMRDYSASQWAKEMGYTTLPSAGSMEGKTVRSYYELRPAHKKQYCELFEAECESVDAETKRRAEIEVEYAIPRQKAKDMEEKYKDQQEKDDAALKDYWAGGVGGITPEDWKNKRRQRAAEMRGQREAIFPDLDTADPKNIIDEYYQEMDRVAELYNGVMTSDAWDEMEAWTALRSTDDQKVIEDNTQLNAMTGLVEKYYKDMELLEPLRQAEDDFVAGLPEKSQAAWQMYKESGRDRQLYLQSMVDHIQRGISLTVQRKIRDLPEGKEMEAARMRWGLGGKPQSPELREQITGPLADQLEEMFRSMGEQPSAPPAVAPPTATPPPSTGPGEDPDLDMATWLERNFAPIGR